MKDVVQIPPEFVGIVNPAIFFWQFFWQTPLFRTFREEKPSKTKGF
jgi:hypothetical protein